MVQKRTEQYSILSIKDITVLLHQTVAIILALQTPFKKWQKTETPSLQKIYPLKTDSPRLKTFLIFLSSFGRVVLAKPHLVLRCVF